MRRNKGMPTPRHMKLQNTEKIIKAARDSLPL